MKEKESCLHSKDLKNKGILALQCQYSQRTLNKWNQLLDPLFAERVNEERAYVRINELHSLGIFEEIFPASMRNFIYQVMPDAVLYHCHAYEIAAQQDRPHVNDNEIDGWHQDQDTLGKLDPTEPHYLSFLIYLSDVSTENRGPFEFLPRSPKLRFKNGLDAIKVIGNVGTTIVFNRSFYHRASPNLSSVRRRVLKLSIQHNFLPNKWLLREAFVEVAKSAVVQADEFLAYMLGKYYQKSPEKQLLPKPSFLELPSMIPTILNFKTQVSRYGILKKRYLAILSRYKTWLRK